MQYAPLVPGTLVFNRYVVVGLAGQGPFGLTYLAHDQKRFDELCLLKEFVPVSQDPTLMEFLRQSFHQEAAALYQLQHLQLPHFRIMFVHDQRLYLVREYIVGKSYGALLSELVAAGRTFSQAEVMQILVQTLPVLAYLHRMDLIHQNICPDNLILRRQDHLPVLIDFGLVKQLVMRLPLHPVPSEVSLVRESYAAPEQLQGEAVSPATDLYALAATAIALLTGQEPQLRPTWWNRTQDWESQVELYPEFARVLKRMLHPNPHKRFTSAKHVLKALEPIIPPVLSVTTAALRPSIPPASPSPPSPPPLSSPLSLHPSTPPNPPLPTPHSPLPKRFLRQRPHRQATGDWKASAILLISVALLVSVISFRALSWVQKDWQSKSSPESPIATNSPTAAAPESSGSTSSPSPVQSIPDRQPTRESGMPSPGSTATPGGAESGSDLPAAEIPPQFLAALTDELFYAKHPDLQGKKLAAEQTDLQQEWTAISNEVQTKLASLSAETRSKLGSYQRADYEKWIAPGNGASVNSRELNVLANNRFGQLFPDQKGKILDPKTFGQVWYAIAEEELKQLKPQQ
jgi:serine/threonine-protein kinase